MSELVQWMMVIIECNSRSLTIAAIITLVAWAIESCKPAVTDPGLGGRWHNFRVFIYLLATLAIAAPALNFCIQQLPTVSIIDRALPNWKKDGIWGSVLATLAYAFVWDFFQYWTHRLEHKFAALWAFHRVHHSDSEMNASTSLRQSVGGALIGFIFAHIPTTIICGGNMIPYVGSLILFSGWGYFNHANFRVSLGPVTYIISGPQWHRLHHGKDSKYHNSNYAAFFPVLDLIFGTLRIPEKNEWVKTGIDRDTSPRKPLTQAFLPWRNKLPVTSSIPPRHKPVMLSSLLVVNPGPDIETVDPETAVSDGSPRPVLLVSPAT